MKLLNYKQFNESFKDYFNINYLIDKISSLFTAKDDLYEIKEILIDLLNDFKIELINNNAKEINTNDFLKKLNKEIDTDLIVDLNLDLFFRGLNSLLIIKKNKKEKIEKYFNKYINSLEKRIEKLSKPEDNDEEDNYYDEEDFVTLKKLKRKVKHKISKKSFSNEIIPLKIELLKMQEWLKISGKSIAILFDGRDAAGKGDAIEKITDDLDPKYYTISTFGVPTKKEKENWFKRYEDRLPLPGKMTLYDRSWYNRAVNDIVMNYCTQEQYEEFMKDVINFEKDINDNNTYLIKLWFSVDKETQELRFELRKNDPLQYWKLSENDLKTMDKWDKFTYYKEIMFQETSTKENPWIVVNSQDKRLGQINSIKYILSQIPYDDKNQELIDDIKPEIIIPMI